MDTFESYRPLLFSIAYRMLGSAAEAEDMVQESYLRYQAAAPDGIHAPKAFLSKIVTNLCLDQLKSARAQRETYIGPWLPEPVLTGGDSTWDSPSTSISRYESISMAFLVLLESLSPVERAVFLLREVFDYDYGEIADIVGKEEAACRQLFHRAKQHLAQNRPRFPSSPEKHRQILDRFMEAIQVGDLDGLMSLLADDVGLWSDGGGKVAAATRPVHGRESVARLLRGLKRFWVEEITVASAEINGRDAVMVRIHGKPVLVFNLDTDDQHIYALRLIANPDKLARL